MKLSGVRRRLFSAYRTWVSRLKPQLKELRLSLYLIRKSPLAVVGLVIIVAFIFIALFGDFLTPYNPYAQELTRRLQPPSAAHLCGTDEFGRDVLSRLLSGAKYSIQTGAVVLLIAVPLGSLLGASAGYFGGKFDEAIMRTTDVFLAFPSLILAMAVSAALGPSLQNVMLALIVVWWPAYARLVRSQALSVKESAYIEAARSSGAGNARIIFRHILPNSISPVIVRATLEMGMVMIWAAGLSFLGFGAQPPSPEWGKLIAEGRIYILQAWWITAFPGLAILLVVLGFNLLGDGLRDILDPKLRRVIEVK
jgi:peptide/nickel transport system permease protein